MPDPPLPQTRGGPIRRKCRQRLRENVPGAAPASSAPWRKARGVPRRRRGACQGRSSSPPASVSARCAASPAAPRSRGETQAQCEARRAAPRSQFQPLPLPNRKIHDAPMLPENSTIGMHDLARLRAFRPQLADDARIIAGGNEAYVLTIGFISHGQAKACRSALVSLFRRAPSGKRAKNQAVLASSRTGNNLVAGGVLGLIRFRHPAPACLAIIPVTSAEPEARARSTKDR